MTKMTKAVAAAVLAMGASAAQAGITIPAGDWTVDIGGNVNAYYTHVNNDISETVGGVKVTNNGFRAAGVPNSAIEDANTIGTGLLPSALGIGAKTRQNDLDIAVQFTFFTGSSSGTNTSGAGNTLNIRQAFLTFGDKSWGTIKAGRDLGIFGGDAILSDMTLLGVGVGAPAGGSSTLGRIGSGYMYADWVGQISYASPNWNGFSFAVGVREPWQNGNPQSDLKDMGFEGKVSYEWGGDISGKVWLGGISQKHDGNNNVGAGNTYDSYTSKGWDIGGKVAVAGFGLVGYYYDGKGLDSQTANGGTIAGANLNATGGLLFAGGNESDDSGGYIQATWTAPFGTKFGLSWGENNSDSKHTGFNAVSNPTPFEVQNESWMFGVYHPLTKSLNLVAEYVDQQKDIDQRTAAGKDKLRIDTQTLSLGAILFF